MVKLLLLTILSLMLAVRAHEMTIYPDEEEEWDSNIGKPQSMLHVRTTTFFNVQEEVTTMALDDDADSSNGSV